jgi:RNA polymerase primary sigma factor
MNRNIIFEDEQSVKHYFKEVKNNALITREEELELALKAKAGDTYAINKLVTSNLRFVIKIAKEYQGNGLSLSDLISEGNIGLIKAVHKFEPEMGYRFISYAVWWIRQSILFSINENAKVVKMPMSLTAKLSSVKNDISKFELEYGTHPVIGDIINEAGDTYDTYVDTYKVYLNDCISEDNETTERIDLMESEIIVEPFQTETNDIIVKELNKILSLLDDREKDIIMFYFGFTTSDNGVMTLETIGQKYDLTKERIRQIKEKAILKLRHNSADLLSLMN